jgi:hypothetical protein
MHLSFLAQSARHPSRWLTAGRVATRLSILCVTLAGPPSRALGQAVGGAGTDATPLPKGSLRISIAGLWEGHDRVYGADSSRPILGRLSTPALGVRALPQLTSAERAIQSLSGLSAFSLSLGTLEADADARQSITPIALDIGLTSRLSIGVVIPYVESRDNAQLILNRDGTSASVGQNPAYSSAGVAARAANGTLLRQIAAARAALSAEVTRCANTSAPNCETIRANPTGAQQLLERALATQSNIASLYGDSLRGGAPVVPISNSTTQSAINTRLGALRTDFAGFGVTNLSADVLPAAAVVVNGPGAIPRIANDTAYGLNYDVLGGTRRAGIGDVDLTASFLWLNTLGARPAQWISTRRAGIRSRVTAGWRFGTAGADRTNTAFDVPIGDGANAFLARSTTDVVLNRMFWMSGTVRLVQPFSDQAVLRRPLFADTLLFVPSTIAAATRTLGRRVEAELAPRLVIGQFFGVSGGYLYRRTDASEYEFRATDSEPATTYTVGERTTQAYMLGVTFSTLSSYVRNRSKWPIEVLYVHTEPLTGSGDGAAAVSSDRLELRVYTGFPRR